MDMDGRASAGRRAFGACLLGSLLIVLTMPAGPAAADRPAPLRLAAVGDIPAIAPERDSGLPADPLIERIQRGLSQAGTYGGLVTGRMNRATEDAIRAYQKAVGMPVDGRPSEALANHLETGRKVDELLGKLQRSRQENVEAARQALLANPATRDLVGAPAKEAADPTRDFAPCLKAPTAACLLAEAAESAKAVAKEDLRDWALGELLAAQARAGLSDEARATVRRITDPRLVMVALRDIAEGQAAAGRTADALEAAGIIPDADKKTEALLAIAAIQAHDNGGEAAKTLDRSRAVLDQIDKPARRVALMARLAAVLAAAGRAAEARQALGLAEETARGLSPAADRDAALRNIAAAQAETGDPAAALRTLQDIKNGSDVTPILIAAANAQAEAGDAEAAMQTADGIEAGRYKAVVFSRIALAQQRAGDTAAALATLEKATAAVDQITLPFARDFAYGRIALALAEMARAGRPDLFERGVKQADAIADRRLRAETLWTLAVLRQRAGDAGGAAATRALAESATRDMKSQLSRVWMFSDLAIQHSRHAETAAAWQTFGQGMALAADIGNAWGRSRAMSRMAVALLEINEPGPSWLDIGGQP